MRSPIRLLLALSFLVLPAACSNASAASVDAASNDAAAIDGGSEDAGSDAAVSDAGPATDAATACTTVVPGAVVTSENVAADPPLPAGGTVADGDYALTAIHGYTGAGGATGPGTRMLAGAVRFAGNAYELVLVERGTADGSAGTFTTSDVQMMLTRACPASAATPSLPFSAMAGSFDLYLPPNLVLTFTR